MSCFLLLSLVLNIYLEEVHASHLVCASRSLNEFEFAPFLQHHISIATSSVPIVTHCFPAQVFGIDAFSVLADVTRGDFVPLLLANWLTPWTTLDATSQLV